MLDYIRELNDDALLDYIFDPIAFLDDELTHYGVGFDDDPPGRGSGRYPHGSGDNPLQHEESLRARVSQLQKQGMTGWGDIARALGYKSSGQLRNAITAEKERRIEARLKDVPKMISEGKTRKELAEHYGVSLTTINNYINKKQLAQSKKSAEIYNNLEAAVKDKHYVDVTRGVEIALGCSNTKLKATLDQLENNGYHIHKIRVPQVGNPAQKTTMLVLGDKDTTWSEAQNNFEVIKPYQDLAVGSGERKRGLLKPKSIDSSRVYINYTDDSGHGGAEKDGLVELRPGVEDISLGNSTYSQVRIAVDNTHYMKGMAVYSDKIPEGYDIVYNTNKKYGTPPGDVFKKMETIENEKGKKVINWDNPFGATIMDMEQGGQRYYIDENGKKQLSVINKVNDEGKWGEWSKTVSSQILSKQPTPLVKKQLDVTYKDRVDEYNEIMALTNPTVKRKLLMAFAEDCDAATAHLKAKAFARQGSYAILPVPSLKGDESYYKKNGIDGEIYAPRFEDGELLALFRHPHASISEIPVVRVNNKNQEAKKMMGNAPDAVGINSNIAAKLSGADFDGDTVVIIPMKSANINSAPTLEGLRGFDPKSYKIKDEKKTPVITADEKQKQMGITTNLIADMSFRDGVTPEEMARVIKHSMVVIDSYKHHLDWKQSELDNDIQGLKDKYQANPGKPHGGGAHTIITKAGSEVYIDERKPAVVIDEKTGKQIGYGIDPRTGKQVWENTGRTRTVSKSNKKDPVTGKKIWDPDKVKEENIQEKTELMLITEDARDLMSSRDNPHPTELAYANYANDMKALANRARKSYLETPKIKRDSEAAKEYAEEVSSLKRKLLNAEANAPRERMAQLTANVRYKDALNSNPALVGDKDRLKKLRGQLLTGARLDFNAKKPYIEITDREWEAIQHRAISDTQLMNILKNTKDDRVRELATPRQAQKVPPTIESAIKVMGNKSNGPTIAEIAEQFGVSTSTVSNILKKGSE